MTRRDLFAAGALAGLPSSAAAQASDGSGIRMLVTGDINWTLQFTSSNIAYNKSELKVEGDWRPTPYLVTGQNYEAVSGVVGRKLSAPDNHYTRALQYNLNFSSKEEEVRYPFLKIADVLRQHDFVFSNLETPLSDRGRRVGAFRSPAALADALRWAGVHVVSIANNHALDAEGEGLRDTIANLQRAGIGYAGGGLYLEDARRPCVVERKGQKIGILAYTQHINMGDESYATPERAGVMPMDPRLIREDIERSRATVDWLMVSVHWGKETRDVHPANRQFAHQIIDWGADLILGHHSPLSKGLEIYKGKLIIYSPGHLLFGHNHEEWGDSYVVRAVLGRKKLDSVEILPIAGRGLDMSQPYLLQGSRAEAVLREAQKRTEGLDTKMTIQGTRGIISLSGS